MCKEYKFDEPAKCPRCASKNSVMTDVAIMDSKRMGSTTFCRCNDCGLIYQFKQIFDSLTWRIGQPDWRETGKPKAYSHRSRKYDIIL